MAARSASKGGLAIARAPLLALRAAILAIPIFQHDKTPVGKRNVNSGGFSSG